ncbi:DnaJ domain containing protein [Entamoeba marina]
MTDVLLSQNDYVDEDNNENSPLILTNAPAVGDDDDNTSAPVYDEPNFQNINDYYKVLSVPIDASQQQIKKAYRTLALQYHPDKTTDPDANDKFNIIKRAYEVLSHPQKRKIYDTFGINGLSFAPYITTILPIFTIVIIVITVILLFNSLLLDLWVTLLLIRLEGLTEWLISAVNVPLYFVLFFYWLLPIGYQSTIGVSIGLLSNLSWFIGVILLFVKVDIGTNDGSYHWWLIPLYLSVALKTVALLESYCKNRHERDDEGNSYEIKRTLKMKIWNAGWILLTNIALIGSIVCIGIVGDDISHNTTALMIIGIIYLILDNITEHVRDLEIKLISWIISIAISIVWIIQVVLLCLNIDTRHSFSCTISFIPILLYILLINIITFIVPCLSCILLPQLKKYSLDEQVDLN